MPDFSQDEANKSTIDYLKDPSSQVTSPVTPGSSAFRELFPYVAGPVAGGLLAKAAASKPLLGMLMSAPQFSRLRELNPSQSMHPGVAKAIKWTGPLTDPEAVDIQRKSDDYVMKNYDVFNRKSPQHHPFEQPSESELGQLHQHGWQYGPLSGISREIQDNPLLFDITGRKELPIGGVFNTGKVTHRAGDVFNVLGIREPVRFTDTGSSLGVWRKPDIHLNKDYVKGLSNARGRTYNPYMLGTLAHEMQHGAHSDLISPYSYGLPWGHRPQELEATLSQFRYRRPESYKYPYHDFWKDIEQEVLSTNPSQARREMNDRFISVLKNKEGVNQ